MRLSRRKRKFGKGAHRRKSGSPIIQKLAAIPSPWLLIDRTNERIIEAGAHIEEILNISRETLIGRFINDLSGIKTQADWSVKEFSQLLINRQGRHEDVCMRRADNTNVVVDVSVSHPPRLGSRSVAFCLITDRSEQRRLQGELISKHQELRKAFASLEDRTSELKRAQAVLEVTNREIGVMSSQLSRASELEAIGEIVAELTHQLNNPMAAATGAARRVEKLCVPNKSPQVKVMIDLLKESLERMRFTTLELKKVYMESRQSVMPAAVFDLRHQIYSAVALLQQQLEGHKLVLEVPEFLEISGRESHIQHVLVNLIDNASIWSPPGSVISIVAKRIDDAVILVIEDSGPGIPEHLVKKIFEPFYTTREHGTGLGLALVKRHLDSDGAGIIVGKSDLGGARFEIEFKAANLY